MTANIKIITSLLFLGISACTIPVGTSLNPIKIYSNFDSAQAKLLLENGKNSIVGTAAVLTENGQLINCSRFPVELIPATDYAKEVMLKMYGNSEKGFLIFDNHSKYIDPDIQDYRNLILKTTCNKNGEFEFNNISDGEFILKPRAGWVQNYGYNYVIGGIFAEKVSVHGGERKVVNSIAQVNILGMKGRIEPRPIDSEQK